MNLAGTRCRSIISSITFAVLTLLSFGALYYIEWSYRKQTQMQFRTCALRNAVQLQRQLDKSVGSTLFVAGMVMYSEKFTFLKPNYNYSITNDYFDAVSQDSLNSLGGITNLQLQPGGIVSYVYPLKGNEAVIGLDIVNDPKSGNEVKDSILKSEMKLYGPIQLKQGGIGFLARRPIYLIYGINTTSVTNDTKCELNGYKAGCHVCIKNACRTWWGFATALLRPEILIQTSSFNNPPCVDLNFQLKNKGDVIYVSGSSPHEEYIESLDVEIPNGIWTLHLYGVYYPSPVFYYMIAFCITLIIVCPLSLYFLLRKVNNVILAWKDSNSKLKSAFDDLKAAKSHQELFLATMSHEIRTPLNGIIGILDVLSLSPMDQWYEMLTVMKQASGCLAVLIDDILDYSKLEAGKLVLDNICLDLHEVIRNCISLFSSKAEDKLLELTLDLDPDLPRYVHADVNRLQQILNNLVSNAIKFTEKGRVSINVSLDFNSSDNTTANPFVLFSVEDTGIGLTSPQKKRLFEPFVQADATIERRFGGTGLGLAIVNKVVALLGGEVYVQSTPGRGSTFYVSLPFQICPDNGACQDAIARRRSTVPHNHGKVLLVVDDTKVNREVLKRMGESLGFKVLSACDGEEALRVYQESKDTSQCPTNHSVTICESTIGHSMNGQELNSPSCKASSSSDLQSHLAEFAQFSDELKLSMKWIKENPEHTLDVVIMDIHMPNMNGYDASAALISLGLSAPIIALTADVMPETKDRAMRTGMAAVMTKPVKRDTLMGTLKDLKIL